MVDEALEMPEGCLDNPAEPISGSGEHLCLKLEKVGDNTEFVARELARIAGCRHFDIGFEGRLQL